MCMSVYHKVCKAIPQNPLVSVFWGTIHKRFFSYGFLKIFSNFLKMFMINIHHYTQLQLIFL